MLKVEVKIRIRPEYIEDFTTRNTLQWCEKVLGDMFRVLLKFANIVSPYVEYNQHGFRIVENPKTLEVDPSHKWYPIYCKIGRRYITFTLEKVE